MSGPSWGASIFIVMAPGRTLLDTDTLANFRPNDTPKSPFVQRTDKLRENFGRAQQAVVSTSALSIRVRRMRGAAFYPHAF